MLDLVDLRAFVRVADLKSVSGAARALKSPKSSVSRSLARLEAVLGATLFERSTRNVRLTEAGVLLQPHARRILNDVEEAETALGSFAGTPRGTLRVSATYAFTQGVLAPMLPGFLAAYPDVRVVLEVENRRIDLASEEADLVIRMGPLPDSDLVARRLTTFMIWLCASPGYLATRGTPASAFDLKDHDIVERNETVTHWTLRTPEGHVEEAKIVPRTIVTEPLAARIAVAGGAGIGRLPDFIAASALARGELVRVLTQYEPGTVEAHALYPSHRSLSAKVRVFIDALTERLAGASLPAGPP